MTGGNNSNRNVLTTEETNVFLGFMNEITSEVSPTLTPLKSTCQAVARATTYFVSGLYPLPLLHFIRSMSWCIAYSTIYQQNSPSSSTPTTSWKLTSLYLANFQKIAWTFRWKSSYPQRLTGYNITLKLDFFQSSSVCNCSFSFILFPLSFLQTGSAIWTHLHPPSQFTVYVFAPASISLQCWATHDALPCCRTRFYLRTTLSDDTMCNL